MNVSRVVSVLLVLVAVVVLVVALVFFFEKKNKDAKEDSAETTTAAAPGAPATVSTLNVLTNLRESKVRDLKNTPNFFYLDARAKENYVTNNVTVNVVTSELDFLPGYTKNVHTLPQPFKAEGLVFDTVSNFGFFPHPLVSFTSYVWNATVLFLTFKTAAETGETMYFHFAVNQTPEGLRWNYFDYNVTTVLNETVLGPKLEELNTTLGNLVALSLDEFVDANTGNYTTELGGVRTAFTLLKRPYTQTDFVQLTHKVMYPNTNLAKPFQLKKVLVAGTELNDLVLPKKPLSAVSVFWWYNVPLLAKLELKSGEVEHFVYNLDSNSWTNEVVDKVRAKLTLLKNKLGVPLTLDLGKTPDTNETTYTTNDVMVRVTPNVLTNRAFKSYTHRFSTGDPHFVGSFVNTGTPQSGLPSLRLNQLSVFFANGVPLVLKFDLTTGGATGKTHLYYTNNGYGFWSHFPLTQELATAEAVLNKMDTENKKLMATNDKYVVDVFSKSDYLSVGKFLKVAPHTQSVKEYTAYTHKALNDAPFKFQKLVHAGKDVQSSGVQELTGVSTATVYWFHNHPLFVKLEGTNTTPAAPAPTSPVQAPAPQAGQGQAQGAPVQGTQAAAAGVAGAVGASSGNGVTLANPGPAAPPLAAATNTTNFTHYFGYNHDKKLWENVTAESVATDDKLKLVLDASRAKLGAATVNVGHGTGVYQTGPVTVTVTATKPHDQDSLAALDVMVHDFSVPYMLGKLKHFDFDMKLTQTVDVAVTSASANVGGATNAEQVQQQVQQSLAQQTTKQTVPFPLDGLVVKKVDVFVFKYVPLMVKLYLVDGTNVMFTNNFTQSTWLKFVPTQNDTTRAKLNTLKTQLTTTSSLDVCKNLTDKNPVTYELPKTFGDGKVVVTLTHMEEPGVGMKGLTHTLSSKDVKLTSLTCGDKVLTGLNLDQVEKVHVYLKEGSVALVKTNSDPKFFTSNGTGLLSYHTLPQGATDLNAAQLGQLLTQVSNNLGPVLSLNLEAKEAYPAGDRTVLVDHQNLEGDWNLYVHHLPQLPPPPAPEEPEAPAGPTPGTQPGPQGPPREDAQGGVPEGQSASAPGSAQAPAPAAGTPPGAPAPAPPAPPAPAHFTVSKFRHGAVDAVGLPVNKSFTDVYVVLKGNFPHFLGLKTLAGGFEWHAFNKYRWLFDFESVDLFENDDLLALAKEVPEGLDNEFDLDLAAELQNEAFVLEQHEFVAADDLEGFNYNTYLPLDTKFPVLLNTLTFNGNLLSVPFLQSHHLNGFAAYNFYGEPVLLHAYTFDNKFLFFENTFEGEWKAVELGELTKEVLKAKLLELKEKGLKNVALNLNKWEMYRNFGGRVNVAEVKDGNQQAWAPFKKFVHTLARDATSNVAHGAEPTFKVAKVLFNGVDLKLHLPKGTVTNAVVFATNDQVPVGLYFRLTGPASKPAQTQAVAQTSNQAPAQTGPAPAGPAPGAQPGQQAPPAPPREDTQGGVPDGPAAPAAPGAAPSAQATGDAQPGQSTGTPVAGAQAAASVPVPPVAPVAEELVVTHNYFFNTAGNWEKLAENNSELTAEALKAKLTAVHNSLGFYVEVDLGQKLPYVFTKAVEGNAAPKVVDFLVQYDPKDKYNFATYTHVPQVRVATGNTVKTQDLYPFVTYFTLYGQRLRGFDLNKVLNFTVYWLDDKFPLLVYVVTPLQHKFYRNTGNNNWSLLKTQLEVPTNAELFKLLAMAKQSFAYEVNVELGATGFPGYWYKYTNGGVALKATKFGKLTNDFNVYLHTSVAAGFPTFFVNEFTLWNRPVHGGSHLGYVHEVKVYADLNDLPLFVEVASTKSNTSKTAMKYTYFAFDKGAYNGWFLRHKHEDTVKLNEKVLGYLNEVKEAFDDVFLLHLDATTEYKTKGDKTVTVAALDRPTDTKFTGYKHTFEGKMVVLHQNGKRVGFDNRPTKFSEAHVYWLAGLPVYLKLKHLSPNNSFSHYFRMADDTWATTLPFDFNFTGVELDKVLAQVLKLNDYYYTLDLGTKTVTSAFGDHFELDLVEYRHANVELPHEMVGYSLLPAAQKDFKLASLKVHGLDFKDFNLDVPTTRVMHAHVYSPDAFYTPLFLELVSVQGDSLDVKFRYDYFHATASGKWTFLNTEGLRLDPAHMAMKLRTFENPAPVFVDFGKREGTYGLNQLVVTKNSNDNLWPFTSYAHKLATSEPFLVSKWVYNGLLLKNLPTLKATQVTVYFYDDTVPVLLEVNGLGLVKFFSTDLNGNWLPDLVTKASVYNYLNYLLHDLTQAAKLYDEWVPHLNLKLLREFELVPEEPVVVPAAAVVNETPVQTQTPAPAAPVKPAGEAEPPTPPTEPETPVNRPQQAPPAPPQGLNQGGEPETVGLVDQSGRTTAALNPNQATTVAPATASEGVRVVNTETTNQQSVAPTVESAGLLATKVALETLPRGATLPAPPRDQVHEGMPEAPAPAVPGASGTVPQPPQAGAPQPGAQAQSGQTTGTQAAPTKPTESETTDPASAALTAALQVPTTVQVPTVQPVQEAAVVSGAKAGVAPLAAAPVKVQKPKRKFRLVPLDFDKLFHGYLTLGKPVNVFRFDTVPLGYQLARHTFVHEDAKHLTKKFFVGDKLYKLPDTFLNTLGTKTKPNALGLYSHLNNPLLLKLGFEGKKPVFFSFDRDQDLWKEHTVVNLEEELEHLNHEFNNVLVFDLEKPLGVHHPYYNNTTYYVSEEQSLDANLFKVLEYETFEKVPKTNTNDRQTYTQLPFRLGKLRHNAVDLPVDGLPFDKDFYTLRVHFSKLLDKPLVLVLYPDLDEKDRKRFERENPGKYLGFHFYLNLDNTWTFFVPEGVNALLNKLKELEAMFKEPATLDLAKVTGPSKLLNYWTKDEDLVVERLFLAPLPTETQVAPTQPAPPAPEAPPRDQEHEGTPEAPAGPAPGTQPGPEGPPREDTQGGEPERPAPAADATAPQAAANAQAGQPGVQAQTTGTPTVVQAGASTSGAPQPGQAPAPVAPAPKVVQKVDPLLGLVEKTGALPTDVMFTEVPLMPYAPVTVAEPATGFEWFYHHTPYFVKTVTMTPPPGEAAPTNQTNSLQGSQQPAQASAPAPTPAGAAEVSAQAGQAQTQGTPTGAQAAASSASTDGAAQAPAVTTKKVAMVKRFQLGKVLNNGVPLDFVLPFEKLATGWAGLTVLYEKTWNTPFLFALFNPKNNSGALDDAFYDMWVYKDLKWVKTQELEQFYGVFRAFELKHNMEELNELLPKFYAKLAELATAAKAVQTHVFNVDLGQDDAVTQGGVVVNKDGFVLDGLDLVKSTFTPKLTTPAAGWVNFTLDKVALFGNKFVGLDLPLLGVTEVNAYFRNSPDRYAKFATVLELVQKLLKDGKTVFKHWYYLYEGGNEWKLHLTTFNKLLDHEVFDLVNFKLFEYHRLSLMHKNALVLDLDTKFSHLSLGRFVDSVEFFHDPTPNAPTSPVPEGFLLYRHSMVTENTTFLLPFVKFNGLVKKTNFLWPFVQYFVYYKVGENVPFVFVLAKGDNVANQPTHHWYYVNGKEFVRFTFDNNADVDPDAKENKAVVAKKFQLLLKTPPTAPADADPLTQAPPQGTAMPTFPATDANVLSKPANGVVLRREAGREARAGVPEEGAEARVEERPAEEVRQVPRDRRLFVDTHDFTKFLAKPKLNLVA